jgi:hypothetical protein
MQLAPGEQKYIHCSLSSSEAQTPLSEYRSGYRRTTTMHFSASAMAPVFRGPVAATGVTAEPTSSPSPQHSLSLPSGQSEAFGLLPPSSSPTVSQALLSSLNSVCVTVIIVSTWCHPSSSSRPSFRRPSASSTCGSLSSHTSSPLSLHIPDQMPIIRSAAPGAGLLCSSKGSPISMSPHRQYPMSSLHPYQPLCPCPFTSPAATWPGDPPQQPCPATPDNILLMDSPNYQLNPTFSSYEYRSPMSLSPSESTDSSAFSHHSSTLSEHDSRDHKDWNPLNFTPSPGKENIAQDCDSRIPGRTSSMAFRQLKFNDCPSSQYPQLVSLSAAHQPTSSAAPDSSSFPSAEVSDGVASMSAQPSSLGLSGVPGAEVNEVSTEREQAQQCTPAVLWCTLSRLRNLVGDATNVDRSSWEGQSLTP